MAYNLNLAERIRFALVNHSDIEEKEMFGGLAFMKSNKMCVGVIKDEMMCRIDPKIYEAALEKNGCKEMLFTGRPMKGWVMIEQSGIERQKDFEYWINLAIEYNAVAKKSTKKKKK